MLVAQRLDVARLYGGALIVVSYSLSVKYPSIQTKPIGCLFLFGAPGMSVGGLLYRKGCLPDA